MFRWIKRGLIFNPAEIKDRPSWSWNFAQGQNVLIFDEFVRVYYSTREKPDINGKTVSRVAYVDFCRDDLTKIIRIADKPVLDLGDIGCFDEFGTYPFCVIRNGDKIYGYYGGVTRCESVPFNVAIGLAVSDSEGKCFHRLGKGPVLSYSIDEPFVVCSPKVRKWDSVWYMTYSAGKQWVQAKERAEVCYKLRIATSKDGINWVKYNKNIMQDKLDDDESQACGDIIYKNNKYHMFYCYRRNLDFRRNKNNTYRIGYAWSEDMFNWHREDECAGIDISEKEDDWDSEMIAYPNVFELDGKIYMLYLGNEVGKYGFGLAELEGELK